MSLHSCHIGEWECQKPFQSSLVLIRFHLISSSKLSKQAILRNSLQLIHFISFAKFHIAFSVIGVTPSWICITTIILIKHIPSFILRCYFWDIFKYLCINKLVNILEQSLLIFILWLFEGCTLSFYWTFNLILKTLIHIFIHILNIEYHFFFFCLHRLSQLFSSIIDIFVEKMLFPNLVPITIVPTN